MRMEYNFGPEKLVQVLAEKDEVVEFDTRDRDEKEYAVNGSTYHVFNDGKWLYCGKDRQEADSAFARAAQGEP